MFKVVKNRLAKLAADRRRRTDGLDELLVGPTALTLIQGDAVVAAKAIADFTRSTRCSTYKGGIMDGRRSTPDQFNAIARLPGVDVLRGQLVGLAASPLTGLVRGARTDDRGPRVAARPDRRAGSGQRRAAGRRGGRPPRSPAEEPARGGGRGARREAEEAAADDSSDEQPEATAEDAADEPQMRPTTDDGIVRGNPEAEGEAPRPMPGPMRSEDGMDWQPRFPPRIGSRS